MTMMVNMIMKMIIISPHLYEDDGHDGEDDFEDDYMPPTYDYDDMRMIIFSSDLYDAAGNLEPLIEANLQPTFANQGKNMAQC